MTTYAETIEAVASLVSYWRLNETSGTEARDSKGTNHGTYSGGYTLGQASPLTDGDSTARSVNFDGSSGYVHVAENASLRPTSVSVEGWLLLNALQTYEHAMVCSNPETVANDIGYAVSTACRDQAEDGRVPRGYLARRDCSDRSSDQRMVLPRGHLRRGNEQGRVVYRR